MSEPTAVVLLVRMRTNQPEQLVAAIAAHGVYVALGKSAVAEEVEVVHISAEVDGQAELVEYEIADDEGDQDESDY